MKKIILSLMLLVSTSIVFSQHTEGEKILKKQHADTIPDGWKTGGIISVNFTQVSLTNWAAGGNNSISLNAITSLYANLKKGNSTWDNTLDLGYGLLKQGDEGLRKTDDKIDFMSKYGKKARKHWYYAGLVNFKSQMAPGYNYPDDSTQISKFLAPGYLLGAIGMDYKPNDAFTLFISPFTTKMTFVNDKKLADDGRFGVDAAVYDDFGVLITEGKRFRAEYGGYLRAILNKDLMENIKLQTKLELFSNYTEDPDHIDVNWEVLIALKVNKFVSATISTQLIYDHDVDIAVDRNDDGLIDGVGPRTQFKEVLGIGLTYKF
ncbi:DUF3078 domain-containing protein [Vicingus serpentipes]|uniref:DUF3078 domain-containing protein n=1 Tax=Vicingus serpentipes TaxID=1926625 RepID=A0A5C6RPU4_9FLAO|nr:DUF3078 domain-containing protein [Vicingus serpentipes]TXB64386.1 DUF3078 domain-containing protein [Vicingus serpentipes]